MVFGSYRILSSDQTSLTSISIVSSYIRVCKVAERMNGGRIPSENNHAKTAW